MRSIIHRLVLATAGIAFLTAVGYATTHDFYNGKIIRIIVGFSPGGAFDIYSRALSRHIGKHIPGNPTVIVENMPGAGSLILANHLYKVAKPDGLTIGNFIGGLLMGQLLEQKGIEFDARKFEYVGTPVRNHVICVFSKASGITDMDKWIASKTPIKMGGIAQGSSTPDNVIRVVRATLGLPIQLVSGYKGMSEIRMATEAGELAGTCLGFRTVWQKALHTGEAVPVLQVSPKPAPYLRVPLAISLAKTEEARKLIEVGVHNDSAIALTYTLPPGTPKDRVAMLRQAFMDTMKDSEFLAEMKKSTMEVDPVGGAEVEKIINDLFKLDPALLRKLNILYKE